MREVKPGEVLKVGRIIPGDQALRLGSFCYEAALGLDQRGIRGRSGACGLAAKHTILGNSQEVVALTGDELDIAAEVEQAYKNRFQGYKSAHIRHEVITQVPGVGGMGGHRDALQDLKCITALSEGVRTETEFGRIELEPGEGYVLNNLCIQPKRLYHLVENCPGRVVSRLSFESPRFKPRGDVITVLDID